MEGEDKSKTPEESSEPERPKGAERAERVRVSDGELEGSDSEVKIREGLYETVDEFNIEQSLRDIYYNPKTGYQSKERLFQKAKETGLNVTRKSVRDWLTLQTTYTKFKPSVKKHKFQRTFVSNLADQMQIDLVDMRKYSSQNKGYYWILTGIEILSRFAFTIPVYRKDTKNMTTAVEGMVNEFKDRFGKYPTNLQFDEGKEFYNVGVKAMLKSLDINYFSTSLHSKKRL